VLKVKDVMDKEVVTVLPDESVREISKMLVKNRLSGVPVVDKKDRLVGFISERDIITAVKAKDFLKKKAKDIMNKKVFSVKEDMLAEEVTKIFTDYPFRYLPVIKEGKVIGIVSRKQIIEKLLGHYY